MSFLLLLTLVAAPANSDSPAAKVDPAVLATAAAQGQAEFLLVLREQADLRPAQTLTDKRSKGQFVYQELIRAAERGQEPLIAWLSKQDAEFRPYWIANMIWVKASEPTIQALMAREDVTSLQANQEVRLQDPAVQPASTSDGLTSPEALAWNLERIGADQVWQMGFEGREVVVGGQDTGYLWSHPALISSYRGWSNNIADHNYNWHDAIHTSAGPCGADAQAPCDDHGHGTHTMGIAVGHDGVSSPIGVAPGARWIGCRNMDRGVGKPVSYAECFQWFLAPTDLQGANADPLLAPDVIINSWSCPPGEGCTEPDVLRTVVENVRAAGIMTVQSAGNSGPSCGSIDDPAAIYEASFTIGATGSVDDQIATYSSRGPVAVDGSFRRKPDVVAPGSGIRSSWLDGGYRTASGTSMAAPHVAGLAALLISADSSLAGQVDKLEALIERSAVAKTTSEGCGSDAATVVPNNTYGYGRIDALGAVRFALVAPAAYVPLFSYQEVTPALGAELFIALGTADNGG